MSPSAPRSSDGEQTSALAELDAVHLCISPSSTPVEGDVDDLVTPGGQVLAHVVGPDGQPRCPRSTMTASCTDRGRPKSVRAPSAARIVRPVNRTSSTRTTSAVEVERDVGDLLGQDRPQADAVAVQRHVEDAHRGTRGRSPRGAASRCASGTPPVCSPTTTTSSRPWLRSMISWAMRHSARWTS